MFPHQPRGDIFLQERKRQVLILDSGFNWCKYLERNMIHKLNLQLWKLRTKTALRSVIQWWQLSPRYHWPPMVITGILPWNAAQKQRFSGFAIPAYSFFAAAFTFAVNLSDVRDMTYRILYYMRTEWTTYVQFKPRVAPRVPAIWMFLSPLGGLQSLLDLVWRNWLLYHTWDQKCACVPIAERKVNG